MVTQFDNSVVENAGLLKMDFLGLKNLTIIKDCVRSSKNYITKILTLIIFHLTMRKHMKF